MQPAEDDGPSPKILALAKSAYLQAKREIRCLPGELSQVFMNIMINAAQAMPESGGTIRIETREEGDTLMIRFKDTGAGMSRDVLDKIFQPFLQQSLLAKEPVLV